jgi:hypothetical protein
MKAAYTETPTQKFVWNAGILVLKMTLALVGITAFSLVFILAGLILNGYAPIYM